MPTWARCRAGYLSLPTFYHSTKHSRNILYPHPPPQTEIATLEAQLEEIDQKIEAEKIRIGYNDDDVGSLTIHPTSFFLPPSSCPLPFVHPPRPFLSERSITALRWCSCDVARGPSLLPYVREYGTPAAPSMMKPS